MKYFHFLLILVAIVSCKKYKYDEGHNRLPNATERGRGIFACYIGDETYIARRQHEINYIKETGYLFLENSNPRFTFRLFIYEGLYDTGEFMFEDTGEEWISKDYTVHYGIKSGGVNKISISRLDVDERIISGTFELDLISQDGVEKSIRDGRFDLNMNIIK